MSVNVCVCDHDDGNFKFLNDMGLIYHMDKNETKCIIVSIREIQLMNNFSRNGLNPKSSTFMMGAL